MEQPLNIKYLFLSVSLLLTVQCFSQTKTSIHKNNDSADVKKWPDCFTKAGKDTSTFLMRYTYKGETWYLKQTKKPETKISDKMVYLKFYNNQCQLVCTWTKGGIAGINKIVPDTIDKDKIIPFVPDTVLKKAIAEKITTVTICRMNDSLVYLISKKTVAQNRSTYYFEDRYYNEDGKLVKNSSYTQAWNLPRKDEKAIPFVAQIRL